MKYLYLVGLQ